MRKQQRASVLRVSEIFDTLIQPIDGTGYIGFIVTYRDGSFQNMVIDYNQFNYDAVTDQIKALHKKYDPLNRP